MMRAFSQRTSEALKEHSLFRLLLPPFQSFLDINVRKEEEKDNFVISTAWRARREGIPLDDIPLAPLLQEARKIDQKFLQQTSVLPVSIDIRYSEIEKIRHQRMERLLGAAYHIFQQWENTPRIRIAITRIYNRDQFSKLLLGILQLYNQETRILGKSVRMPRLIGVARDKLSNTVYSVMEDVAGQLVPELADIIYGRNR